MKVKVESCEGLEGYMHLLCSVPVVLHEEMMIAMPNVSLLEYSMLLVFLELFSVIII